MGCRYTRRRASSACMSSWVRRFSWATTASVRQGVDEGLGLHAVDVDRSDLGEAGHQVGADHPAPPAGLVDHDGTAPRARRCTGLRGR